MKTVGQIISMLGYAFIGVIARNNGITGAKFWLLMGCVLLVDFGTFIKYGMD